MWGSCCVARPAILTIIKIGEHDYMQGTEGQWLLDDAMAYSNNVFEGNLMAGDANDEFYVRMKVKDDNDNDVVNYGLNNNRFKIYHKDGWLGYNKLYLQLPKDVSDAIEGSSDAEGNANLTFVFNNSDGSTDKISSVEFFKNAENDIFYNPYGQWVSKDTKSVVINNGRKYVNKWSDAHVNDERYARQRGGSPPPLPRLILHRLHDRPNSKTFRFYQMGGMAKAYSTSFCLS